MDTDDDNQQMQQQMEEEQRQREEADALAESLRIARYADHHIARDRDWSHRADFDMPGYSDQPRINTGRVQLKEKK